MSRTPHRSDGAARPTSRSALVRFGSSRVTTAERRLRDTIHDGRDSAVSMLHRLLQVVLGRLASERGDVPGWVLITLMTAGIVVALWAVASEQIVMMFENAMKPFLGGSIG